MTNHFHNGVYTGTHFNFTWTNAQGQKRFQIGGQHNARDKMPKPENAYCFAHATEITWSIFLFDYLAAALEQVGFLQFNTKPGEFVRIGGGFLEFGRKGATNRINREEIKTLSLNGGVFTVQHQDARWYSSKGHYSFQYSTMGNARLFLIAVERLLGYRFG